MKTYILHHNDSDGFCAAAAYKFFRHDSLTEYHPVDYGWTLPKMEDGSRVIILDFHISREELDLLVERMYSLMIYDHHESAMKKLKDHPHTYFDMTRSGCMIAWDEFSTNQPPNDFVRYVQEQDLGRATLEDSTYIKNYIFSLPMDVDVYMDAFKEHKKFMAEEGKIITRFAKQLITNCLQYYHIITVDEYRMLCINSSVMFSDIGSYLRHHMEDHGCDFAGCYYRLDNDHIKFSLRSDFAFNVAEVAERFKGGGHSQAAGFEVPVEKFNWRCVKSNDL